jgi:hypothetical protein
MSILKEEWSKDFLGRVELHKNGILQSIAGYGSSLWNVRMIIKELPNIFKRYDIKNMLDIPCGDFFWMKEVDLSSITYLGVDLVDGQIDFNKKKYPKIDFKVLNMVEDSLPKADLVFTRDCLVHLNYDNIKLFIDELIRNGSKYLMATHCPEVETNMELNGIIGWRPLNLEKAPFNFPKPIEIISEQSDYNPEKCMGIWSLEEIKKI